MSVTPRVPVKPLIAPTPPDNLEPVARDYLHQLSAYCTEALTRISIQSQQRALPTEPPNATVADLTTPFRFKPKRGSMAYVTDDATGEQPVYADGTTWRRMVFSPGTPVA